MRGFAGYFLEQESVLPALSVGDVAVSPGQRLALFILAGIVVSVIGVKVASDVGSETLEDVIDSEGDADRN